MLTNITSGLSQWLTELQYIFSREMSHLSPQQYCVGLALCIAIGYTLLQGRS